ncbi:MAG: hypothetical protein JNL69_10415 [Bacteroidia bacterium]|nr:hypothetical protein [Bacteroidia bacterium]
MHKITLLALLSTVYLTHAQNVDSIYYYGLDTTGIAQSIADDEKNWRETDTVVYGNFSSVDEVVLKMKKHYRHIHQLAKDVTAPFKTEEEKVRAIFCWITANIAYDTKEYHIKNKKVGSVSYKRSLSKQEKAEKWEEVYYKYASKVLRKNKGVCEGYATLFYELCKYNNITCEVVLGKVKKERNGKIRYAGHAWNKVYFNEQWFYIDATWASGYCDEKVTVFTPALSNYYYITCMDKPYPSHIEIEKRTKRRNDLVGNYLRQ